MNLLISIRIRLADLEMSKKIDLDFWFVLQIEKLKAEFADKERCLHEEADIFLKNIKKDYE